MNPKAITSEQMYGVSINDEWQNGVFTKIWEKYNKAS